MLQGSISLACPLPHGCGPIRLPAVHSAMPKKNRRPAETPARSVYDSTKVKAALGAMQKEGPPSPAVRATVEQILDIDEPLAFFPANLRAAVARVRIDRQLVAAMNALRDGADVEERATRLSALNVIDAMFEALHGSAPGHAVIASLERRSTKFIDQHVPGERVVVPRDHRTLASPDNKISGGKATLMDIIEQALAGRVRPDEAGSGADAHLRKAELDRVLKSERRTPYVALADESDSQRQRAHYIALMVVGDLWDQHLLESIFRPVDFLGDVNMLSTIISYALRRGAANAPQLGRAVAYMYGVPWGEIKNFFSEDVLHGWQTKWGKAPGKAPRGPSQ